MSKPTAFQTWPVLELFKLPRFLREILAIVPQSHIGDEGFLHLDGVSGNSAGKVPLAQTQWNIDRDQFLDRLLTDQPWGIVLHWYGDDNEFDNSLLAYLRGFDSLRRVEDYITRTSAHFLVGDQSPRADSNQIGIIQTQKPYQDGIPTLASHIHDLDFAGHSEREQYFVRALYQLSFDNPNVHSILQDWFDGPKLDPNDVTIAIEITGKEYHKMESFPSKQKIANTLSLLAALMKRYEISATNILGHHEIDLRKPDPGKEFAGLLRILIGLKALQEDDAQLKDLVFGQFLGEEDDFQAAVEAYFKFVRDFLVLVARPEELFDWEDLSKYWFVFDGLSTANSGIGLADKFDPPIPLGTRAQILRPYDTEVQEGVDIYCEGAAGAENELTGVPVKLTADGLCLYTNDVVTAAETRSVIFRHRLLSGSEVISIYSNLSSVSNLTPGKAYPRGYKLGSIDCRKVSFTSFLRFAIAYAGTWDTEYKNRPYRPLEISAEWVEKHFLDPLAFIDQQNEINKFHRLIGVPVGPY